jgi:hypothetical protein
MKLRLLLVVSAVGFALAGCTSSVSGPQPNRSLAVTPPASPSAPGPSISPATGPAGCGSIYPAGSTRPAWVQSAGLGLDGLTWVLSSEQNMVGMLFGAPFRAGSRDDGRSNKILWISREPRNGATLKITGTSDKGDSMSASQAADASPGEIYPSIVDVPAPGCWHLNLAWGPNTATVDLYYGP